VIAYVILLAYSHEMKAVKFRVVESSAYSKSPSPKSLHEDTDVISCSVMVAYSMV
jgi:hypothetical protein